MGRSLPKVSFRDLRLVRDGWTLAVERGTTQPDHLPSLFAIGNGFIGIRGPGEAGDAPKVYLNGVYESVPIAYHEAAHGYPRQSDLRLAVADATQPAILIGDRSVAIADSIALDLARCVRTETRNANGIEITIEQFASMTQTGLVLTRVIFPEGHRVAVSPAVTPPPGKTTNVAPGPDEARYDPRIAPAMAASPWTRLYERDEPGIAARTDGLRNSGFLVACAMQEMARRTIDGQVQVDFVSGYRASRDRPAVDALPEIMQAAVARGYDALLAEQIAWFADFWSASNVAFPSHPEIELAIRHSLAELAMAVGRDGRTSIGAKGQTGEGYEGHVFWDADLYVLPVFAFTYPAIARAMLEWRISCLAAARDNARAMGHERGALYPWRTIGGHECSSYFPAGSAQYHINADIAYALETYLSATADHSLLTAGGAEMLVETARIWLQIGFHDADRGGAFVVNRVTGPDEYSAIVNNNLYTNMMAARHLRLAAREGMAHGLIDAAEAAQMVNAADAMLLPFDDERGVYAQDDAYFQLESWPFDATPAASYPLLLHFHPLTIYRRRVSKQADAVLALALMPDAFDAPMRRRMLETYEATTVHDSTLSAGAFAVAAARAGNGARAAHYWRVAALTDLCNLFGNTDHGLHMAALAGSWTTLAMGFAGMRVDDDTLCFDPIEIPGVSDYRFTVAFRGAHVDVAVSRQAATVSVRGERDISVRVNGEDVRPSIGDPHR